LIAEIARRNDLSRATLRQIKSFLSAVFKHAKRLGFLDGVNPMQDVSIPRTRDSGDTYAYSHDEVKKMLTVLAEPAKSIVAVAAYSGLRRGEIQGLRWEDYDGSYLHVARSVWEGFISEPKTKSSKASVPVIQTLSRYLDTWRFIRQSPSSGVMFVTTRGTPMRLNNVLRGQMLPAFASAGLEWHGWHGFRRGLATNLHLEGVDDLTIKNILRHSDVAVTQRSYIKPVSKKSVDAMTKLDERVSKLNEPSEPVVQ
jgi:integrase